MPVAAGRAARGLGGLWMVVQGCFAAHVVPSLPLEMWNLSTQQLVLGREQRGQAGTLVSSSMETLIFTHGRQNLGLGLGL